MSPTERAESGRSWSGTVWLVELLGSEQIVHVAADGIEGFVIVAPADRRIAIGDVIGLHAPPQAIHRFDATTGRRLATG